MGSSRGALRKTLSALVIPITDSPPACAHTLHALMKRSIQLVALVIVALLAIQPALADVLCLTQAGPQPMEAHGCCASSADISLHQHRASSTPSAQMQSDCNAGCCSVSPQNAPPPNAQEKAQTEPTPIVHSVLAAVSIPSSANQQRQIDRPNSSPTARHILLQVFRI
jgi:hypothetical protein